MNVASKVFFNGTIITMEEEGNHGEAIAILEDRILAVGTDEEMESFIGEDTVVIDLAGKTVLPGFHDSHSHFATASEKTFRRVNFEQDEIQTIEDCLCLLREQAKTIPEGGYVLGYGFDNNTIKEQRHLNRRDLDSVSTEHRVFVSHKSPHIGYANSKVLEYLGYTKESQNPNGGILERDEDGELNGVLRGFAASALDSNEHKLSEEEKLTYFRLMSERFASKGVTTANDAGVLTIEQFQSYQRIAEQGGLTIRLNLQPFLRLLKRLDEIHIDHELLEVTGMKMLHDGSIPANTAYLSEPYITPYNGNHDHRGSGFQSREKLVERVRSCYEKGLQLSIHCIGDAAADDMIAAIGQVKEELGMNDHDDRPILLHGQILREEQLEQMSRYGIQPSFHILYNYVWGERCRKIFLGNERASNMNPAKSALDHGLIFSAHCDTPVFAQEPLLCIWTLVARKTKEGNDIGAHQRIDRYNALKAYTINSAYQFFQEKERGSLAKGKLADIIILSDNPLTCELDYIKDITVLETIVGGKTVYTYK